jgi:hypothetical protein
MSSILYYSNNCEPSKKLLQNISKTECSKDIHFMCIDRRVKDANGQIFIVLQNGQKIVMPPNVTQVPALLLLNQNYKVIYGDDIYQHLRPKQQVQVKQATQNNMEPLAFAFGGGSSIVSDHYSFLDQNDTDLSVKGNGGVRQMHNYVSLNDSMTSSMHLPTDETDYKTTKMGESSTSIEAIQRQREADLAKFR